MSTGSWLPDRLLSYACLLSRLLAPAHKMRRLTKGYPCNHAGSTQEYDGAEIERRFNAPRRAHHAECKRTDDAGQALDALSNSKRRSPKLLNHQLCEQAHRQRLCKAQARTHENGHS